VRFLANDNIDTPTSLVGKKVAPIFEAPGEKAMPESLDIIKKIDSDPQYGPVNMFLPMSGRADLKNWQSSVADSNRIIIRPRYMMTLLPEFMQTDGKNAFVKNHALPPFEKDDWKKLTMEEQWKIYEDAFVDSSRLIPDLNKSLEELEALIHSPHYCTEGGVSLDDIDLFSRLRSITLVKGIKWPKKVADYMHHFSRTGDIPLYDSIAV
jgi:glutaredoxin 2